MTTSYCILHNFLFLTLIVPKDQENLVGAKDALGLESGMENTRVVECLSELADLKEVWEALLGPFQTLEGIKDTSWSSAVMRKVRRGLDDLLASMRSLPNRIRQYDAYVSEKFTLDV